MDEIEKRVAAKILEKFAGSLPDFWVSPGYCPISNGCSRLFSQTFLRADEVIEPLARRRMMFPLRSSTLGTISHGLEALRKEKLGMVRILHRRGVIGRVRRKGLTYLDRRALEDLARLVHAAEKAAKDGILIEAGCALGGSAITMTAFKKQSRPLFVYDAFGMIPPPSARDGEDVLARYETIKSGRAKGIAGGSYYGYEPDLKGKVIDNFARLGYEVAKNNVHLVEGLFQESLEIKDPVLLAHIDCDWYESVMTCLERIAPALVPGGTLVIDDYDAWSGCRKAVDDYFSSKRQEYQFVRKSRLHIVRADRVQTLA